MAALGWFADVQSGRMSGFADTGRSAWRNLSVTNGGFLPEADLANSLRTAVGRPNQRLFDQQRPVYLGVAYPHIFDECKKLLKSRLTVIFIHHELVVREVKTSQTLFLQLNVVDH